MVVRGKSSICRAQLAWVLALYFALFSGRASLADETDLMDQATALYEGVATSEPVLRQIRGLLDRIVADYPESDLALRILLQEEIGALDVAEINARLADARPNPQPIQSG